MPRWSCCQQLWIHCKHTAAQVGLPWCPTDKAQKSWHRRWLLGHFWGLDVLDQGQAPWPQRLSQYQLLEVLSWREKPFFELVAPDQILHLLTQCLQCAENPPVPSSAPFQMTCGTFMNLELVVVISFNSHDTTFASWHIFTCHNALWLFKNSHNPTFRVVAVSLMPQRTVVDFSAQWAFSIFERNKCLLTNITVLDCWCMYKAPITTKNYRHPYHRPYTHVLE
jgi:hypothetical protein